MYVGYLGPIGSFTHNAALKAFPKADLVSLGTITEVIKSYEEGRVDYAVIPVENSIEGSVHESLDYLFPSGGYSCCGRDCSAYQATVDGG